MRQKDKGNRSLSCLCQLRPVSQPFHAFQIFTLGQSIHIIWSLPFSTLGGQDSPTGAPTLFLAALNSRGFLGQQPSWSTWPRLAITRKEFSLPLTPKPWRQLILIGPPQNFFYHQTHIFSPNSLYSIFSFTMFFSYIGSYGNLVLWASKQVVNRIRWEAY